MLLTLGVHVMCKSLYNAHTNYTLIVLFLSLLTVRLLAKKHSLSTNRLLIAQDLGGVKKNVKIHTTQHGCVSPTSPLLALTCSMGAQYRPVVLGRTVVQKCMKIFSTGLHNHKPSCRPPVYPVQVCPFFLHRHPYGQISWVLPFDKRVETTKQQRFSLTVCVWQMQFFHQQMRCSTISTERVNFGWKRAEWLVFPSFLWRGLQPANLRGKLLSAACICDLLRSPTAHCSWPQGSVIFGKLIVFSFQLSFLFTIPGCFESCITANVTVIHWLISLSTVPLLLHKRSTDFKSSTWGSYWFLTWGGRPPFSSRESWL